MREHRGLCEGWAGFEAGSAGRLCEEVWRDTEWTVCGGGERNGK